MATIAGLVNVNAWSDTKVVMGSPVGKAFDPSAGERPVSGRGVLRATPTGERAPPPPGGRARGRRRRRPTGLRSRGLPAGARHPGGRWAARNLFRSVQVVPVLTSASRPGLALLPRPAAPGPVVGVERRFPEPS